MKKAGIYVNDVFCGVLTEDEEGYHFSYEKDYLASQGAPISPTMPLTEQQYDKEMMFSVFDGLIPGAMGSGTITPFFHKRRPKSSQSIPFSPKKK